MISYTITMCKKILKFIIVLFMLSQAAFAQDAVKGGVPAKAPVPDARETQSDENTPEKNQNKKSENKQNNSEIAGDPSKEDPMEEYRSEAEIRMIQATAVYEESVQTAKEFKKETANILKDGRAQIREQIARINALLKNKVPDLPDSCDPSDPDCVIDCRAYKGVCVKGHCCF